MEIDTQDILRIKDGLLEIASMTGTFNYDQLKFAENIIAENAYRATELLIIINTYNII